MTIIHEQHMRIKVHKAREERGFWFHWFRMWRQFWKAWDRFWFGD